MPSRIRQPKGFSQSPGQPLRAPGAVGPSGGGKRPGGMTGTFSIVAMDPERREWGVAVASRVLDVGYIVPWMQAEVGAVATQALTNPHLAPWALQALGEGASAQQALDAILARDSDPGVRQVGIVDRHGNAAAHTGASTQAWAGHRTSEAVSVQGNILVGPEVVERMLSTFQVATGPLAERLLLALEAGEQAGGDRRGKQSSALKVVRRNGGYQAVDDRLVDLKVVDQAEPVAELRRLYDQWQYAFLVEAYCRLADDEPECSPLLMRSVRSLLDRALQAPIASAEVFNNLAWHLALRKKYPEETLRAAQRAQELAPADADVLDTLAEAWYAAGDAGTAAHWEEQALGLSPGNEFFQRQLDRFRGAAGPA
ncbi:MAG: DUF1028 domain-containing protein [Anaerolineales bacterium]|nr:DUF1028 domain-containing protein [Anaerolineales bacterium]